MTVEKETNVYTPEVISDMISLYTANPTAETVHILCNKLNKSERSVIAKLSSLQVYKKKTYVTKQGTAPVRKEIYIEKIAALLDIDFSILECLEKSTKQALILMHDRIAALKSEPKL